MKKIGYYVTLLLLIAFCASFAAYAQISVHDNWAASGELALEGADWTAVFSRKEAALTLYSGKREALRIAPFYQDKAEAVLSCEVMDDRTAPVRVKASFSAGQEQIEGIFHFGQEGSIEVEPIRNMKGIHTSGEISFGIVPAPPLEDLIYDPADYPSPTQIYLPSENVFLGLLRGEDRLFFCAWPEGEQKIRLMLSKDESAEKAIEAVEIELGGKSLYMQIVSAPGVWHREELQRSYLDRDIEINWRNPFPARWKTQLLEGDIQTCFPFITWKYRTWRPNFGFYEYPVWFEGGKAFLHLGKRVPPSGQCLIYALEGHKNTPVDFAQKRVGSIPALKPKKGLQRYPSDNVGIQNCDGRAWVKWIFKMNLQTREKEFLQEALEDFIYSINMDEGRLAEYEVFIPKTKERIEGWIQDEKGNPEIEGFLVQMKGKVEELEKEYWSKMLDSPVSKHLEEETGVIRELMVLINEDGLEIYPEVVYLLDRIQLWSDIEAVPGRVGGLMREMFQAAGYGCAKDESLVSYAQQIRRDLRDFIIAAETHETVY